MNPKDELGHCELLMRLAALQGLRDLARAGGRDATLGAVEHLIEAELWLLRGLARSETRG